MIAGSADPSRRHSITIIHDTPARTNEERAALFRALRELKRACGKNKQDQITTLIDALLGQGIDTRSRISRALQKLDFSGSQVAAVFDEVNRRRWRPIWSRTICSHVDRLTDGHWNGASAADLVYAHPLQ